MQQADIELIELKQGTNPTIVFINGFLQEDNTSYEDWLKAVSHHFPQNACYGLSWPSNTLWDIVSEAQANAAQAVKISPIKKMTTISKTFLNAWKEAVENTEYAGKVLSRWLARQKKPVILMGHSLGARIIHHALVNLKNAQNIMIEEENSFIVQDVYLLGGAISSELKEWQKIEDTFSGTLYNIYSENDSALKSVYFLLTLGEDAIGNKEIEAVKEGFLSNISLPESIKDYIAQKFNAEDYEDIVLDLRIVNFDASELVLGHTQFKDEYQNILAHLHDSDAL